jgi:putative endonuclease
MRNQYYVYIMANERPTLYIGITNDLIRRVYEHREHLVEGFTRRYGLTRLVYFEVADNPAAAIQREKQLKKWNRAWKLRQIREVNPNLEDLYETLIDPRAKPEDDGKLAARDDKARSSA